MKNSQMTKKQFFANLINIVENADEKQVNPEEKTFYVSRLNDEINMIDSRNASRKSAQAKKKAAENEPIKKAILAVLNEATDRMKASEIRDKSPELRMLSTSKISAVLRQMTENAEVSRTVTSVKNGVYTYRV